MSYFDDEIESLYAEETSWDRMPMRRDGASGKWRERVEGDDVDFDDVQGFSALQVRPGGDSYESERYDAINPDDEAAGWLAYHENEPRDDTRPSPWLAGYDLAASSGRDPYVKTQEDEMLQELRDELGEVEDFLHDVQERLDEAGESRAALAREMGLHATQVSRWFNGHVGMTLESMLAMRDALETLEAV